MKPFLDIRYVAVSALPIYTCVDCAARATGSTVRIDLRTAGITPDEVKTWIERNPVSNTHLPDGWSGYGTEIHRCAECTRVRNVAARRRTAISTAQESLDIGQAEAIERMNRPDPMDFR